jgi:sugar lactone lactonase YvrE
VADPGSNRITKLSPGGVLLARWRVNPTSSPAGSVRLAVDGRGNVYLAVAGSRTIVKLSPRGTLLRRWTLDGATAMDGVTGLALDARGNVFVAAADLRTYRGSIVELSPAGKQLARWEVGGAPADIALDVGGNMYAAYYAAGQSRAGQATTLRLRLARFTAQGRVLSRVNLSNRPSSAAIGPPAGVALAVDRAGTAYVVAISCVIEGVERVPAGGAPADWSLSAPGAIALKNPGGLALDGSGNLYIADTGNRRIVEFSPAGKQMAQWGKPAGELQNSC